MFNRLKRLPWSALVNLPLAALLGYALMRLFLPAPSNASLLNTDFQQSNTNVAQNRLTSQQQLNMRSVLQAHLFGHSQPPPKPAPVATPSPINAPETKLQLTLQGTFLTSNKQDAQAIIAPKNGTATEYSIGQPLPGGAKLQDIQADKVILEHQRRLETLSLLNEQAKAGVNLTTRQTSAPAKSNNLPTHPPLAVSNTNQNLSQRLQQYRQRIQKDSSEMAKLIRVSPTRQQGKFIGYTLNPGRDAALFKQIGLRAGDILTHLNGRILDAPMKGLKALNELAETDFVELQILRNGSSMQFSFSLR